MTWVVSDVVKESAIGRHPATRNPYCPACSRSAPMDFDEPMVLPIEGGPQVRVEIRSSCEGCGAEVIFRSPATGRYVK